MPLEPWPRRGLRVALCAWFCSAPAVYAPEPFRPGASIGHWDTSLSPDEVIEPFYTIAVHDLGLLLPAMIDMGWEPVVATPTPRASPATPTPTYPPRPTPPPTAPGTRRQVAYVTNFDDGTVSVIDPYGYRVTATVAVGEGPVGIAAAPDGTRVYVANFHAGTLAVVSTRTNQVLATIPVGESPNRVAVTSDGATETPSPTPTATRTATSRPPCEGDCDGDGAVSVDELIEVVRIALGDRQVGWCRVADGDRKGVGTVAASGPGAHEEKEPRGIHSARGLNMDRTGPSVATSSAADAGALPR